MERYGSGLIEDAEALFCAGSGLILSWTRLVTAGEPVPFSNLQLGIVSAARMAETFYSGKDLAAFFALMSARFLRGFSGGKQLKTDLDTKYRSMRREVEEAMQVPPPGAVASAMKTLLRTMVVVKVKAANDPPEKQQALLADLIHMQLNRTFQIKQRQLELLVYYFLDKYTASLLARRKKMPCK
jgi:thiopeptide-type bacteriocin biosynthesis protein